MFFISPVLLVFSLFFTHCWKTDGMLITLSLLIVGLMLLVYASDRLVYGASVFAQSLKLPPAVIGIVIVGMGTSLPELFVATDAAIHNLPEIAIGTAIGSSLTNLLLIAGIGAMIYPMNIQSAVLKKELPLMIIVILLAGLVVSNGHLELREGCLLFFIGFASLFLMIKMLHKTLTQVRHVLPLETLSRFELQTNPRNSVALFWVVIALLIIPVATRMIIDNVFIIMQQYHLSSFLVGLTLLSIGTSLPELATTVVAALRRENELALGNIIGANIFNLTFVLGMPALLSPSTFNMQAFYFSFTVLVVAGLLFSLFSLGRKQRLNRGKGIFLLVCFIVYITVLCVAHSLLT